MTTARDLVVAVNTLSVTDGNEGIRTMLTELLPALGRVAPEVRQLLVCSEANRHLFQHVGAHEVEVVPLRRGQLAKRLWCDQVRVPRVARGRADVLLTPSSVGSLRCPIPQVVIVPAHLALPSCRRLAGGEPLSRWHRAYYGPVMRRSLRSADRVLGISQFVADGLVQELGVDRAKVGAMPLGVTAPSVVAPLQSREPMVLFAGTLYPYKDADVAVAAFAAARPELPAGARLVVVGRDPTGTAIGDLVARSEALGVGGAVEVLGSVDHERLEALYQHASLLLMPSRCEGFGLPVAEAMSRGVPVVVARATALPEVGGDAAATVEPGDVHGFAAAITTILGDEGVRRDMVERGLRRAAELSWDASAERLRRHLVEAAS